ncbi:MAG TPA: UDP-N-acetylmuramoyl-L-alanyl-D-glutamate--2,6-diaminopimelate ligase [Steroidobacteraceae bacterium]|nr:UDP-N-acetylmuramoyl-L-alanyl-D-glutamate--2,6-diaminopimelate ligase [Steroidobacteraceae bacterium]
MTAPHSTSGTASSASGASGGGSSGGGATAHAGAPRRLADLTAGLIAVPAGILVRDITLDSRSASPGSLFLACRGRSQHGLKFARQAVARGARAVLFEQADEVCVDVPAQLDSSAGEVYVAAVPHLSQHVGTIADRFFGEPSQSLTVAGITGTNGKTTCAWLLAQALTHGKRPAAYIGTLGFGVPPSVTPTQHTTSDAVSVHRQLAALREAGAECVCMEVSSHAIDQARVAGVRFNTAAFTNLTRDHLDYHGTMEAYGEAKARLFEWPSLANRVINIDDTFGARLAAQASTARLVVTTRGARPVPAEWRGAQYVRAVAVRPEPTGSSITIESSWGNASLRVPLIGEFNADNVLTVLAVLLAWNLPLAQAAAALASCRAPSGRMELFDGGESGPLAIVDYAHTPDALAKALQAARKHCRGRLRVVFGCGGERDPGKRPQMGRVAESLADEVIVTDDNPRTEDPAHIIADILGGMHEPRSALVEHDRAQAIQMAVQRSGADDVVLIAGKGHEDYQIIGTQRRAFSDQAVVGAALQRGAS